jgi:hypothetical protein
MTACGLGIKGVPLEYLFEIEDWDAGTEAYATSRAAFDARRGPGTPLLERAEDGSRRPAPHVRSTLVELLAAKAAGEPFLPHHDPVVEAAAAEMHLALVEAVTMYAANLLDEAFSPRPETARLPAVSSPIRLSVTSLGRPKWLVDGRVASIGRMLHSDAVASAIPEMVERADVVLRARDESAHWAGIHPTGREGAQRGLSISEALADAAASAPLNVSEMAVPDLRARPAADPEWLKALIGSLAHGGPETPLDGALGATILNRFAEAASPIVEPANNRTTRVVAVESLWEFLQNHDLMDDYELELLPG